MKTVLMIAPYFPPRRRVGSLRPFKFAIHLKKYGWQPVILTIGYAHDELTQKEKNLLDGIKIIEVNPPFDKTAGTSGKKDPTTSAGKIGNFIANWIDRNTPVDSWIFLFWMKYLWIMNQVKAIKPDLIWSTGDPWSAHWLADKLAKDLTLPWAADFRDPWTLATVNLRQRSAFSFQKDREAERRVIENADQLIFTSETTEDLYDEYYGTSFKSTTIYNSSDKTLFENEQHYSWNKKPDPSRLHLFFYGSFRRLSPAGPVAEAIKALQRKDPHAANLIRVHSFGTTAEEEKKHLHKMGLTENFVEHKPVLPEFTLSVLNSSDVLLISTHAERKHIIPAKLWDYLAANRPVLSIAPNPEIGFILEKSNAGVQIQPGEHDKIAECLAGFLKRKQEGNSLLPHFEKSNSGRAVFDAENTTSELASIFEELTGHG
ncbi:MAG: glycosyltransferase [Balneolaceae bacterium]